MSQEWSAELYDGAHRFVSRYGESLVAWLAPQPNERILDLGCGTGDLTARLARSGADVVGVDASEAMLVQARTKFPSLAFVHGDAIALPDLGVPFDAVFSNAVFHWIPDLRPVAKELARVLRPSGRFVAEFGGEGCNELIFGTLRSVIREYGFVPCTVHFFRPLSALAEVFEWSGFRVIHAEWFPRDTPLEGLNGMLNFLRMFGLGILSNVPSVRREEILVETVERLRPLLFRGGVWHADYTRQRLLCTRL